MPTEFFCHFATTSEYQEHLQTKKPVLSGSLKPYLKIGIHKQFDSNSALCRLYHCSDGNFFRILDRQIYRHIEPIREFFENGRQFYLTANGVVFYKVLDMWIDANNYLEVAIQRILSDNYTEKDHFFMVMPFGNVTRNHFYQNDIRDYLQKELQVSVFRADNFTETDVIVDTIFREIEKSEFIICDITEANKNVFFELGYAFALNKKIIYLLEKDIPHQFFDISHIRRIEYSLSDITTFQQLLKETIKTMRGK